MQAILKSITRGVHLRLSMWLLTIYMLAAHGGLAQRQYDSIEKKVRHPASLSILVAPAALIGVGIFVWTDNGLITREGIREFRNKHFSTFSTTADDYIQYAPLAIALGLKALGVKNEHSWAHTIDLMIKSEVLIGFFTLWLKYATQVPRPDSGTPNSFPSGHTIQAFTAATLLHKEFGKNRPWVSITAYALASSVGIMRILRDRHWASDVLVGAGLGILLTQLVYLMDSNDRSKKKNIKIAVGHLQNGAPSLGVSIPIR